MLFLQMKFVQVVVGRYNTNTGPTIVLPLAFRCLHQYYDLYNRENENESIYDWDNNGAETDFLLPTISAPGNRSSECYDSSVRKLQRAGVLVEVSADHGR